MFLPVWFYWVFNLLKNFSPIGDVTIAGVELQILTYAGHLWPWSSEGSLACHTYCDTGNPFIMVISEDPWHSHLFPSIWQWSYHYLFWDLVLSRLGFEHPTFRLRGERSNPMHHRRGHMKCLCIYRGQVKIKMINKIKLR